MFDILMNFVKIESYNLQSKVADITLFSHTSTYMERKKVVTI